ncbi:MAG TPA: FAD-dependent oxidoreductase [Longimicrobiales bacterium]|nr:FAD-dependent oxidoreductase [Longimicrobiales bacterium]
MSEALPRRVTAQIAVVGAGPAGIAAAVRAAEAGARVVVLDEAPRPGGQIWRHTSRETLPPGARRWIERLDACGARVLSGATVVDAAGTRLLAQHRGEPLVVSAERVILATGARELFLPFPGWTLPGVVGVGGAQALLKAGTPVAGKRVMVAGSGPLLLPVAAALAGAGARVAVVAEQASPAAVRRFAAGLWRMPGKLWQAARYRAGFPRARYRRGAWVMRADGDATVREATLTDGRRTWTEPCDLLAVGFGLTPATELPRLLGCRIEGARVQVDAYQHTSVSGILCAGEPTGIAGVEAAVLEGQIAACAAMGRAAEAAPFLAARDRWRRFAERLDAAFALRDELRTLANERTIVCRCEDVPLGRIDPGWGARAAKLYTRAGMGPCQGRICGAALQFLFDWTPDRVRVPVAPAAVGTLVHAAAADIEPQDDS